MFADALKHTVGIEGRFVDDPKDSGGATMWGITERTARAHGYTGPMPDMPVEVRDAIYRDGYWNVIRGDDIDRLSAPVAGELFDTAVNMSPVRAATFLQRALNVLNDGGSWYADIPVDGVVGKLTVAALREFLGDRPDNGEKVLLRALNALQGEFYVADAEGRAKDERFVFGWFLNRVG